MKLRTRILILCLYGSVVAFAQQSFEVLDTLFRTHINSDLNLAEKYFREQQKVIQTDEHRADFCFNAYAFYKKKERKEEALTALLKSKQYIKSADLERWVTYYRLRAKRYYEDEQFERSNKLLLDFIKRSKKLDNYSAASLYNMVANNYVSLNDYNKAIAAGKKIEELLRKHRSERYDHLNMINYIFLGNTFQAKVDYDSAFFYYDRASSFIEKTDNLSLAQLQNSMAVTLCLSGDTAKAITYYKQAIATFVPAGQKVQVVHAYYNLGDAYLGAQPDSALHYYKLANTTAEQMNYSLIRAYALQGIGQWYFSRQKPDSAINYYEQSIPYLTEIKYEPGLVQASIHLANCYRLKKDLSKALRYARSAYLHSLPLQTPKYVEESSQLLAEVFFDTKQLDSSIFYAGIYHRIKDSLENVEVRSRVGELNLKFETELKEEENKRLTIELERKVLAARFWKLVVASIILILVGVFIWFYIHYRHQKQKMKIQQKQVELEQINNTLLLSRLKENSKIIQSKSNLIELLEQDRSKSDDSQEHELATNLLEHLKNDDDLLQFVIEFELVYKGFYDRLRTHLVVDEQLTKNDQRISAMVKLNLANKEIADLLYISLNSVKRAKSRLYTKINHPETMSCGDFIRSL